MKLFLERYNEIMEELILEINKEVKQLLKNVKKAGWTVERTKGRKPTWKLYCPCGKHTSQCHESPSDSRFLKQKLGDLRKCPENNLDQFYKPNKKK